MYHMFYLLQDLADRRPWKSEDGVTAIEYGLIAALVAVVIIAAVTSVGSNLGVVFNGVAAKLHT
jgi:pilus assembly protein Flp/PilA